MNVMQVLGVFQVIVGIGMFSHGLCLSDMRKQEKIKLGSKIKQQISSINISKQTFSNNGDMMSDAQGNKLFYACKDVDELTDKINKALQ